MLKLLFILGIDQLYSYFVNTSVNNSYKRPTIFKIGLNNGLNYVLKLLFIPVNDKQLFCEHLGQQ
jgi:hypothetical protein